MLLGALLEADARGLLPNEASDTLRKMKASGKPTEDINNEIMRLLAAANLT